MYAGVGVTAVNMEAKKSAFFELKWNSENALLKAIKICGRGRNGTFKKVRA